MIVNKTKDGRLIFNYGNSPRGVVNGLRERVVDTTISPYRSVVHIGNATGIVVGKDKVLSCAHTIDELSAGAPVIPALNGELQPFGSFKIKSIELPEKWGPVNNNDLGYDYGIATIEPNDKGVYIGELVPPLTVGLINITDLWIGMPITTIGYPHDKGMDQMWLCPGKLMRDDGKFYHLSGFLGFDDHFLVYDADQVWGNSGGPVLNNRNEIIGLANWDSINGEAWGEYDWGNAAVMINDIAHAWITERIKAS